MLSGLKVPTWLRTDVGRYMRRWGYWEENQFPAAKRNLAHIQGEVMWEFGIDGEFTETMFQWVRQIASTCSQSEINHVPETVDK